eukprot:114109-Amphidinium_carterae.1
MLVFASCGKRSQWHHNVFSLSWNGSCERYSDGFRASCSSETHAWLQKTFQTWTNQISDLTSLYTMIFTVPFADFKEFSSLCVCALHFVFTAKLECETWQKSLVVCQPLLLQHACVKQMSTCQDFRASKAHESSRASHAKIRRRIIQKGLLCFRFEKVTEL